MSLPASGNVNEMTLSMKSNEDQEEKESHLMSGEELIFLAESAGYERFWEYEGDIFMLFYNRFGTAPFMDIPDIAFMYMEINNWQGMSVRCGVWQYYESGAFQDGKFERVMAYLRAHHEEEMASVYALGIQDYANEIYRGNYDYPEEWFEGTDTIDEWIRDHEDHIYKWMYDLIMDHKKELLKTCGQGTKAR